MRRHEIPTHLDVQDKVLFGLTTRQTMHLLLGLAAAAAVWTHLPSAELVPVAVRFAAAAVCLCAGLVTALARPHGRGIEEWAVVVLRYAATPRRSVWRPIPRPTPPLSTTYADASPGFAAGSAGWIDLSPSIESGRPSGGAPGEAWS
jgi:hypothetical protein